MKLIKGGGGGGGDVVKAESFLKEKIIPLTIKYVAHVCTLSLQFAVCKFLDQVIKLTFTSLNVLTRFLLR